VAVGAAVASPGRKVISLNGDGAGAYTLQGLWTMAREQLDVTVLVVANHAYRILSIELARTGADKAGAGKAGTQAQRLLDLGDPQMDWVELARGFGLPAVRCADGESLDRAVQCAVSEPGPHFIEAAVG